MVYEEPPEEKKPSAVAPVLGIVLTGIMFLGIVAISMRDQSKSLFVDIPTSKPNR